jgi:CBS-domain-containing membrane protein
VGPRIADSPYGFGLVVSTSGVLLGRLRASALNVAPETTVRPDTPADELAQRLRDRDLKTAILTTPEGHLLGITRRADFEQRSHGAN